jgi:hypothetical protein
VCYSLLGKPATFAVLYFNSVGLLDSIFFDLLGLFRERVFSPRKHTESLSLIEGLSTKYDFTGETNINGANVVIFKDGGVVAICHETYNDYFEVVLVDVFGLQYSDKNLAPMQMEYYGLQKANTDDF